MADKYSNVINKIPDRWKGINLITITDSEVDELIEDIFNAKRVIHLPIPFTREVINELFKIFHCRRCGDCCVEVSGSDGVFLFPEDIERLLRVTNLSKKQFKKRFTYANADRRFLPFPCPFYDSKSHSCKIYYGRPINCRLFPFYSDCTPVKINNLDTSTLEGMDWLTVNSLCPEGRRIASEFIKTRRDILISKSVMPK